MTAPDWLPVYRAQQKKARELEHRWRTRRSGTHAKILAAWNAVMESLPEGSRGDGYGLSIELAIMEVHLHAQAWEDALASAERAAANPDAEELGHPHLGRGLALLGLGREGEAAAAFAEALRRDGPLGLQHLPHALDLGRAALAAEG